MVCLAINCPDYFVEHTTYIQRLGWKLQFWSDISENTPHLEVEKIYHAMMPRNRRNIVIFANKSVSSFSCVPQTKLKAFNTFWVVNYNCCGMHFVTIHEYLFSNIKPFDELRENSDLLMDSFYSKEINIAFLKNQNS